MVRGLNRARAAKRRRDWRPAERCRERHDATVRLACARTRVRGRSIHRARRKHLSDRLRRVVSSRSLRVKLAVAEVRPLPAQRRPPGDVDDATDGGADGGAGDWTRGHGIGRLWRPLESFQAGGIPCRFRWRAWLSTRPRAWPREDTIEEAGPTVAAASADASPVPHQMDAVTKIDLAVAVVLLAEDRDCQLQHGDPR